MEGWIWPVGLIFATCAIQRIWGFLYFMVVAVVVYKIRIMLYLYDDHRDHQLSFADNRVSGRESSWESPFLGHLCHSRQPGLCGL